MEESRSVGIGFVDQLNILSRGNASSADFSLMELGTVTKDVAHALAFAKSTVHADLSYNMIAPEIVPSLGFALSMNSSLVSLNLRFNSLGDTGAELLSCALSANRVLIRIDLGYNSIEARGARAIAHAIAEMHPRANFAELFIGNNALGDEGALALAECLNRLRKLSLRKTGMGNTGARAIGEALHAKGERLQYLDLGNNRIAREGGEAIAQGLTGNYVLTHLDISQNILGESTACALAEALDTNSSLVTLDLSGVFEMSHWIGTAQTTPTIGFRGAQSLLSRIPLYCGLQSLNLSANHLRASSCFLIYAALVSQQFAFLKEISLGHNTIGLEGLVWLAMAWNEMLQRRNRLELPKEQRTSVPRASTEKGNTSGDPLHRLDQTEAARVRSDLLLHTTLMMLEEGWEDEKTLEEALFRTKKQFLHFLLEYEPPRSSTAATHSADRMAHHRDRDRDHHRDRDDPLMPAGAADEDDYRAAARALETELQNQADSDAMSSSGDFSVSGGRGLASNASHNTEDGESVSGAESFMFSSTEDENGSQYLGDGRRGGGGGGGAAALAGRRGGGGASGSGGLDNLRHGGDNFLHAKHGATTSSIFDNPLISSYRYVSKSEHELAILNLYTELYIAGPGSEHAKYLQLFASHRPPSAALLQPFAPHHSDHFHHPAQRFLMSQCTTCDIMQPPSTTLPVESLSLDDTDQGPGAAAVLSDLVTHVLPELKYLNLANNAIGSTGCRDVLAGARFHLDLRSIDISGNTDTRSLQEALRDSVMEHSGFNQRLVRRDFPTLFEIALLKVLQSDPTVLPPNFLPITEQSVLCCPACPNLFLAKCNPVTWAHEGVWKREFACSRACADLVTEVHFNPAPQPPSQRRLIQQSSFDIQLNRQLFAKYRLDKEKERQPANEGGSSKPPGSSVDQQAAHHHNHHHHHHNHHPEHPEERFFALLPRRFSTNLSEKEREGIMNPDLLLSDDDAEVQHAADGLESLVVSDDDERE